LSIVEGSDVQHYKYNVALLEEVEAALPEWRGRLLSGLTIPSALDQLGPRHDEYELADPRHRCCALVTSLAGA
jgi:hypothetical protein